MIDEIGSVVPIFVGYAILGSMSEAFLTGVVHASRSIEVAIRVLRRLRVCHLARISPVHRFIVSVNG